MDGYRLIRRCYRIKDLLCIPSYLKNLKTVMNEPSVYPDMPRKSRRERLKDNLVWFVKNHDINKNYNTYGLDVVGFRKPEDFVPYRQFAMVRDDNNFTTTGGVYAYNRVCVLRDKSVFAAFVSSTVGSQYVIPVLAHTEGIYADVYRGNRMLLRDYLEMRRDRDTILKKVNGECGDGIYLLSHNGRGWMVNHRPVELEKLIREIEKSEYIIQDRLMQHEVLNRINPSSVNTIRFVTIMDQHMHVQEFSHFLRIGVHGSVTDNRATGGYAVNISENGVLCGKAIGHHDTITVHPDTGVVFAGIQLPYWNEVRDLVRRVHEKLPDIRSIGWDVAITPEGPVLIEGNDNWEIGGPQDMEGGLKQRWNEMMFGRERQEERTAASFRPRTAAAMQREVPRAKASMS